MDSEIIGEGRAGVMDDDAGMIRMIAQIVDEGALNLAACLDPPALAPPVVLAMIEGAA